MQECVKYDHDSPEIDKNVISLEKLDSLHKGVTRLKNLLLYCVPADEYKMKSNLFESATLEAKTLIIGKLYVLLTDDKFRKHNSVSFRILIEELMRNPNLSDTQRETLKGYFQIIKKVNRNYRTFRNRFFAHVELNADGSLPSMSGFGFSDHSIRELFALAEDLYQGLRTFLGHAAPMPVEPDHEAELRAKVFACYAEAGLIQKRR